MSAKPFLFGEEAKGLADIFPHKLWPDVKLLDSNIYGDSLTKNLKEMKRHNYLLASLLILIGMGAITVSCEKEKNVRYRKAKIVTYENNDKTGEDDEDPIIRGKVKKRNLTVIDSALVETFVSGTNLRAGGVFTDKYGDFKQQVVAGIYYLKVTVPGNPTPFITDTIHVSKDRYIDVFVD